ncbi:MAG TPA: DUF4292 domain-containing protein [Saprospiraceae bacterium]|nr:DUF4292 domain-containing protein [Saprospiraceae bacterium]HMQ82031.1 DUF4292 domain-containing protein [Saprospiraceae bacterium]
MNKSTILSQVFWLLLLALVASNCSSTKKGNSSNSKLLEAEALVQQMDQSKIKPEWFGAKVQIGYTGEDQSFSATANIRMRKDSLVWLSVKKFGFELGRLLVTRDSVYMLDRINNEYTVSSLNTLAKDYGLPPDLSRLQDFFLGNLVVFSGSELKLSSADGHYLLESISSFPKIQTNYAIDQKDRVLRKMEMNDPVNEQKVIVQLEEYGLLEDAQNFSYLRNLAVDSRDNGKMQVELKFSKVEIDVPQSVQFSVPDRYTRSK